MSASRSSAVLVAHRLTPCSDVSSITVDMSRSRSTLSLHFILRGRLARLALPQATQGGRADELWRHTCFEAFVARSDDAGYYEINLSPSQQWAVYRFDGYRSGMRVALDARVRDIVVRQSDDALHQSAQIVFDDADLATSHWQLGVTAVIEDVQGAVSYWASTHTGERPDFHARDGFALRLDGKKGPAPN